MFRPFSNKIIFIGMTSCLLISISIITPLFIHAQQKSSVPSADIATKIDGKSARTIAKEIKNGKISEQDVIDRTYQKIKQKNPSLNSVIYQNKDDVKKQIKQLQKKSSKNMPFYGVPILIKGLGHDYKGFPNTEGLPDLKDNKFSSTNSYVKKLKKLGFIIIGSTNFPELGLINITNSNLYGATHNPWSLSRNAGGSSGGATASVASDMVPIATGSDAGGSLRIPASWSSVVGLKPTQGMIIGDSTTPSVVNFADTHDIKDTKKLFNGLKATKQAKHLKKVPKNLKSLKIAYSVKSPVGTPVSQDAVNAVNQAVTFLKKQGFTVVEKDGPVDGVKMMETYYLGALGDGAAASEKLGRKLTADDVKNKSVSPMTYALYEASRKAPKNVNDTLAKELKTVHQQMTNFHKEYPIYLTPTTATTAPLNSDPAYLPANVTKIMNIKDLSFDQQMQLIYDSWLHGLTKTPFTQLANISGEPALSLPTYVSSDGLPLGIQLEGAKNSDQILLALGRVFEKNDQFKFLDNNSTQFNK